MRICTAKTCGFDSGILGPKSRRVNPLRKNERISNGIFRTNPTVNTGTKKRKQIQRGFVPGFGYQILGDPPATRQAPASEMPSTRH